MAVWGGRPTPAPHSARALPHFHHPTEGDGTVLVTLMRTLRLQEGC